MKKFLLAAALMACTTGSAVAQQSWIAKWIAAPWSTPRDGAEADGSRPMPVFRREFEIKGKVTQAELRIAGLGQFEVRIGSTDGTKLATPRGLHEAWTDYKKTVIYQSYDVTNLMKPGPHAIGVMLGNGMYNVQRTVMPNGKARYTKFEGTFGPPKLIAQLQLKYADGHAEIIATNATWKVAPGPVIFSSTYGGEDYDARKEQPGWNTPNFNDASWSAAAVVEGPGGKLTSAIAPELVQFPPYAPIKITELPSGRTVYDLGQNFAGVPHVQVQGPAGATLKLIPGELLNSDGSVSQASSGGPMWWTYTLDGAPTGEDWQPRFGYYGFRYIQAEWITPGGKVLNLAGIPIHSNSPVAGSFESSNQMLNRIHALIVNAMHNNEASLFTDCPHREKLGWLEETHLVASGLLFNNNLKGLFAATAQNIADAQHADGDVPTTAPQYTVFGPKYPIYDDSPEWGSASILAPWAAYRFYGDRAGLAHAYSTMQAYIKFLESKATNGIVAYGLGDWYDIGPGPPGVSKNTSLGVTGTLMLYEDATAMSKIATLLGHAADASSYTALANREKAAFNTHFWNAEAGYYDRGSQTANAMPLALGIVPEDQRAAVLAHIIADIRAHNDHVTTGEVGYPYLLRALMQAQRNDVVLAMLLRTDPPSYGSQLAAGATSLTEAWDANPHASQDHFMLGGAEEWFYRALGGIDFDMSRAPDQRITIRPALLDGVDWVKCSYDSKLGRIESGWKRTGSDFAVDITIPVGATATISLPPDGTVTIPHAQSGAFQPPGKSNANAYRVPAGTYHFTVSLTTGVTN